MPVRKTGYRQRPVLIEKEGGACVVVRDRESRSHGKSKIGVNSFLESLQRELKDGSFYSSPCRRVLIPKLGKPGKFRPLGIPTVKDRIVQSAIKQVLEPLLEARFKNVSYGFRPGRGCHGALEHIRMAIRPKKISKTDGIEQYHMSWLQVMRFRRGLMKPALFTLTPGEPDA